MDGDLSKTKKMINERFRYGSSVKYEEIQLLIDINNIKEDEVSEIYEELESLDIDLIYSKDYIRIIINEIFILITNEEIKLSELLNWYNNKKINYLLQNQLTRELQKVGVSIINDLDLEPNYDDLDLDFDEETDLDSLIDSEEFKAGVASLKEVIRKENNIEYLEDFSYATDIDMKKRSLEKIVVANEGLVWKVAMKYKHYATPSFSVEDMYQEGVNGLTKAAERFDISLGNQFSTYSVWWIRQSILRGIANYSTLIRIPVHMREKIQKYNKAIGYFWSENSRVPSDEELSKILSFSLEEIKDLKQYIQISNLVSFDLPIGEGQDTYLIDFIKDNKVQTPQEFNDHLELKEELENSMNSLLTEREKTVIRLRYGIDECKVHTLEEIGNQMGVTRERIRQIESKALGKLKKNKIKERLKPFYYDN
ncbi:sigma-70 family RNA polymerase sigma factor [Erysipelothrix sp. HDW6A]|uniref:sigma-70 family RNA polymerase sigma factor n=1 Tax=Erysipelothrix sp. HDW6A TaxID=2714928 RepID=UPI00140C2926|nr:sigma-70 family RNA polymerase sigma factor [Erysipelothrix sp. HDW6A]QIK56477.1 sigma-70 family RNA polymerase sigma factor [Erysipelothrix sp. HDW6A]